ncbi:MAG TPA: pyruvate kinase [Pyrinomonadaceae bacterium]|nr:pyruvate kinase [Pyrinomonadaceae bacterium]
MHTATNTNGGKGRVPSLKPELTGGGTAETDITKLEALITELNVIRSEMLDLEQYGLEGLENLHQPHKQSAKNLLHYLALRRHDLRPIQERLASQGLSSLGRAEAHVKANIDAIASILYRLTNNHGGKPDVPEAEESDAYGEGMALLKNHTEMLLGPTPARRNVRIMVTMPSEASENYALVRDLLSSGMDCMRINCAYDDSESWAMMIDNLHQASKETGRSCRIMMDLPGPKLRTGPIEPGPEVAKWRPRRDLFGSINLPARIWLTPAELNKLPPVTPDAILPVLDGWLTNVQSGDMIKFFDTRGASRSMRAVERVGNNWWAESNQTAYIASGTPLHIFRTGMPRGILTEGKVGKLPARQQWIHLKAGHTLILTRGSEPGRPAIFDESGRLLSAARIGVTLPQIFDDVRPGEKIWLDDGVIGGVIKAVTRDQINVQITHTRPNGSKLRADKGINLPDTELHLPALTEKDIADLPFISRNADLVGYSFVRKAEDVIELQNRLAEVDGEHVGVVLKIETRRAFNELPSLLLAAMRSPSAGVMIARGDLAVECGWERMAEVQEEILWICEAAHMPVIWATQVLENLTKEGVPSRAEITDAAMGERAECVMLNKGPYIIEAVCALDDILGRMEEHQSKKRSMLRHLSLADNLSWLRKRPSRLA